VDSLRETDLVGSILLRTDGKASSSQVDSSPCQFLDWDSNFFGFKIARVTRTRLDSQTMQAVLRWCDSHQIDCLYFLADATDDHTIGLAEESKFHFVDIRATFERQPLGLIPQRAENSFKIRLNTADDIAALRAVARVCYGDTRFYYDSRFPVHLADALYETWIEKSCRGDADCVLVAEIGRQVVGYISCHLLDLSSGQIGLVGVRPDCSGMGLGQMMVNEALRWFAERSLTRVRVVTQGRNCQAQRLYERCGFLVQGLQLWYHRWFSVTSAGPSFVE
jgi:ribosomal protein S18 acetylase RimI-like enzyme